MRIECGTTTEHRVRLGIFLAMCLVFAAYFAYDGLWGYPGKNLEWARQSIQNIPAEQKESIRTNPKVMMSELAKVAELAESSSKVTDQQVRAILGDPAVILDRDGGTDHVYIGPAACAHLAFGAGGTLEKIVPLENVQKSETDIKLQKVLGIILGVVALGTAVRFVRLLTMRTILDDDGLIAKGRRITWDDMTELDTGDYQRKGWLDLVYRRDGDTDSVRLDSYDISRFDEIINTLCERKGFTSPIRARATESTEGDLAEEEASK